MARASFLSTQLLFAALLLLFASCSSGRQPDFEPERGSAVATWSGAPDGAGSEAGECGYFTAVKDSPWYSNVTAVSPKMFRGGAACGTCWDLIWAEMDPRIAVPVRVVVTDVCRGGPISTSSSAATHSARSRGHVVVSYTRVDCKYQILSSYRVDGTATIQNFLLTPMYVPGYETISVSLANSRNSGATRLPMARTKGQRISFSPLTSNWRP